MSQKTRIILFISFLVLFIFTGVAIVFYSQGWSLNLGDCRTFNLTKCPLIIEKMGAIFVTAKPKGVAIRVDNQYYEDESKLLQNGTLIKNIAPRNHKIEIRKSGYLSWSKTLTVEPGMVTQIANVVLVPENIIPKEIPIANLRGNKVIDRDESANKIIVQDSKTGFYYLYDLDDSKTAFNINFNLENLEPGIRIKKIVFHPFDSYKLIIETRNNISMLDTLRLRLDDLTGSSPMAWSVKNPNVYYLVKNKTYNLYAYNLVLGTKTLIAKLPIDPGTIVTKLIVSDFQGKVVFLNNLNDLFIYDPLTKALHKIAHNASDFALSPDNDKIAFFDKPSPGVQSKLNIYFINDWQKGIRKKAGDVIGLNWDSSSRMRSEIKSVIWHKDSYHLFANRLMSQNGSSKKATSFIEIDNRSTVNTYPIFTDDVNFFYDLRQDRVYFVKNNTLYYFEL